MRSEGATNKYYLDGRVQSFVYASTTIPKTYTANAFTAGNTFTTATATQATTTNFAITAVASSLLKTNALGSVVPAIAGLDYALPPQSLEPA